jgi:hypothetical protein
MEFLANIFKRAVANKIDDKIDTTKTNALALLDDPKAFMAKMMEDRLRDSVIGAGLMTDAEYEAHMRQKIMEGTKEKALEMPANNDLGVPNAPSGFIRQMPNYLNTAQSVLGRRYG